MADALVEITSGLPVVLKSPTTTSPFRSVLAITFAVCPFVIIDASIPSCSTESTDRFSSSFRSGRQRRVRLVPRISGDEASDHRLSTVRRSGTVRPSPSGYETDPKRLVEPTALRQLPTSTESKSLYPSNTRPPYLGSHRASVVNLCATLG